jgi:hypothetical protein
VKYESINFLKVLGPRCSRKSSLWLLVLLMYHGYCGAEVEEEANSADREFDELPPLAFLFLFFCVDS